MTLLEQRYRTVLRLLPASYRRQHEEAMVAAYLDSAGEVSDEEDPKPTLSEIASVAAVSLRARLGDTDGRPGRIRWGDAVRLVALHGLLYQAFTGCLSIISSGYLFVDLHLLSSHRAPLLSLWQFGTTSPLSWAGDIAANAGVVAAYLTLLRGHRVAGKILALCILALIAHHAATTAALQVGADQNMLGAFLGVVTVAALYIGFHRDAPPVIHRRRWFVAWVAGGSALLGAQSAVFIWAGQATMSWLALTNVEACLLLAAGTAGYAVLHLLRPGRYSPAWPLALTILTVTVLMSLFGYVGILEPGQLIPVAGIGVAAGVVDVLLARHASTTRPPVPMASPVS